eukprot:gb/GECG01001451.1/.p1 GENE.gb/GECG01001451.1/~~gb/GECG01001451.1/.p1  ORF type:complete len:293 (+),score=39.86 gb/GECG01001451.1/:1-879(+)
MAVSQRAAGGASSKCPFSTMNLSMMAAGALVGVAAPPLVRYIRRHCSRWCCSGAGKDEEQLKKESKLQRDETKSGMHPQLFNYMCKVGTRPSKGHEIIRQYTESLGPSKSVMCISPDEGQFLKWLVSSLGFKRGIEVGVFTGYGTLSLASGLPADGTVVALDITDEYVKPAGLAAWKEENVDKKIDLRIGNATETMSDILQKEGEGSYDFVFIDADKTNYDTYYERGLQLVRKGGVIIVDNTLWQGYVADPNIKEDECTVAIRSLNDKIFNDSRVEISILPLADGVTLCRKV